LSGKEGSRFRVSDQEEIVKAPYKMVEKGMLTIENNGEDGIKISFKAELSVPDVKKIPISVLEDHEVEL
jgi:hypothetical protein